MKKAIPKLNKILLATAVAAAFGVASTSAMAVVFPDFNVAEGSVPGSGVNNFTADKITGNYVQVISFDGAGNFAVSLRWNAGQFVADDGTNALGTQLNSFGTDGYGLYALYTATGTFVTAGGVSTFTTNAGSGNLSVYIDPNNDTTFTAPADGTTPWTTGMTGDPDFLIGTGTPSAGQGTLNPNLSTCDPGINCGSFGTTSSFALTAAGSAFFTSPVPFYNVTFQSGQLNNFDVTGTQTINGSLDAIFSTVPEPGSLALLGIGLLGLGMSNYRRR
ncbi:MAG: flocculation-associated PEP-CTERM protein PepA, partial [Nitrosospira sp.]